MITGESTTIALPEGYVLSVVLPASSEGRAELIVGDTSLVPQPKTKMAASRTYAFGPHRDETQYSISCSDGSLTYSTYRAAGVVGIAIDSGSSVHGSIFDMGIINNHVYCNETGGILIARDTCFLDAAGAVKAPVWTADVPAITGGDATVGVSEVVSELGTWTNTPTHYDVTWYLDSLPVFVGLGYTVGATVAYTYLAAGVGRIAVRGRNDFGYTMDGNGGHALQMPSLQGRLLSANFTVNA